MKSLVGELRLRFLQAEQLGVKRHSRISGLLEKACLRLSANESFQNAEVDMAALTGIEVGHSTQQRLVGRQSFELPEAKQGVSEVSIDGGKVRLRDLKDAESAWRDYKAVRLEGLYYGAFYQDNWGLVDYVNAQRLISPLVCLGDGHSGGVESVRANRYSPSASGNSRLVSPQGKPLQSWGFAQAFSLLGGIPMARTGGGGESLVCRLSA